MNYKPLTKEMIYEYLMAVSKEYKKLSNKMPIQVLIVGGASVLLNYGFRESTMDIDAFYGYSDAFKQALLNVSDKYDFPKDLLNDSFVFTGSFTNKLLAYSTYYKTFSNVMEVRTIKAQYLIAMKLAASRDYKYDLSDIIGILAIEKRNGNVLTLNDMKTAVINLYGSWDVIRKESQEFIIKELENDDLDLRYKTLFEDEKFVRNETIKNLKENNVKQDEINVKKFLELAKKKRDKES